MAEKRTSDSVPATPVAAATVMLVRDSPEGVEVFLMERSGFGAFGGLHVFPGGKIDATDAEARWTDLAEGVEPATANATLGLESGGLDYWVATIRECFEEAGVLLATRADGRLLPLTDPDRRARFAAWRARLNAGEKGAFEAMCKEESLRLATDRLAYVSHWITPVTERKRFNTRFFLARAPSKQEALHDGFETVESAWIRPDSALDRWKRGDLNLISPTFTNLQGLVGYDSTESLLRAKRAVDPATIPVILPKVRPREGGDFDEEIAEVGRGGRLFEDGR